MKRCQSRYRLPSANRCGFTLLESTLMVVILSVWTLVVYAVATKKPDDTTPTLAPSAEIKVIESIAGDEPDAQTRAESQEPVLPEAAPIKVESR
jgi:hypothetical protein